MLSSHVARATAAALVALATLGTAAPTANAAWLDEAPQVYTFRLDDPTSPSAARLPLLDAFHDASVEPGGGLGHYLRELRGRIHAQPWWTLSWAGSERAADAEGAEAAVPNDDPPLHGFALGGFLFGFEPSAGSAPALSVSPEATPAWLDPSFRTPVIKTPGAVFASNGFDALWTLPPAKPIPNWRCRRRPVRMVRYAGETDAFLLVRCDGSVAVEAFDRLTLMARETSAPRPGELLPDEPDPEAVTRGEWTAGVRLVHPRLLWVLQRLADAFPWRTIYVISGYRHDPSGTKPKPGTHHSMHSEARAMDISMMGIPNAALWAVCHKLEDVGCGYYPNNKFVHVDVRRPGSGHPFWIDVSEPGEPSTYVDSWPGVVESGGLVWDAKAAAAAAAAR
jgi:hypothetical protein